MARSSFTFPGSVLLLLFSGVLGRVDFSGHFAPITSVYFVWLSFRFRFGVTEFYGFVFSLTSLTTIIGSPSFTRQCHQ